MQRLRHTGVVAMLVLLPALAAAQLPGEPKAPPPYDATGDAKYRFQLWAPDERVREAQRVLGDRGYYHGPLDGLMTPAMRRAVWNFQKAQDFRPSGRLELQTMAALGLGPDATTAKDAPSNFADEPSASPSLDSENEPARSAPPAGSLQAP